MDVAAQIRRAAKEIDQVAVAVSVVGTRRVKLIRLAELAEKVSKGLVGERPEVKKLQLQIRQRIHDVRTARTDQSAAEKLRDLRDALLEVGEAVRRGLGTAPAVFRVAEFPVGNPWGYSQDEARRALDAIGAVVRKLRSWGVSVDDLTIILDPSWKGDRAFAFYDPTWETVAITAESSASEHMLAWQVALWLWDRTMNAGDRETWAGDSGRFAKAFADLVTGSTPSDDESARLRVTVGRSASRWPG